MEILCPNCQRKLTILEQYAGQQMKCPLCAGAFQAPALPATASLPAAPVDQVVPPSSAPGPVTAPDTLAAPLPQLDLPPAPVPTEHTGRFSIWISPRICQFVPIVLLFLVFVLSWFTWVAFAPGGVYVDSQNAWQAAVGSVSTDPDLRKTYSSIRIEDKDNPAADLGTMPIKAGEPGISVVTIFWLLAFLANSFLIVAAVAVAYVHGFLPPKVQPYLRWRWAAVALVTLLCFLLLILQDSVGFNLERNDLAAIDRVTRKMDEAAKSSSDLGAAKRVAIERGVFEQAVVRTFWYRCAFWFYFWALVFVFITMFADLRSPRPSPRVDLLF
jgi:hypothetical protein